MVHQIHKPINAAIGWARGLGVAILVILLALANGRAQVAPSQLPPALQDLFREGVAAQKAGQLDEAEKAFLKVLEGGGKVAFVYNNLGIVYQQRGDLARAIAQFREAIRLQPDYVAPRILLGASLLATRQVPEATRHLERAVKLQPREPLARLQLAKAYERAGNAAGVVAQYRALQEIAPQDAEYVYQLGNAYLKYAGWCVQEIARVNPRSARLYQVMAENSLAQGRLDLAERAFQRAAQADPGLPEIHYALAQVYLQQGKPAEARHELERELAIAPESVAAAAMKRKLDAAERQVE